MEEELLKYHVPNDLSALSRFLEGLRARPEYGRQDERKRYLLELILEEMISNIVKYGYDDDGKHEIDVVLRFRTSEIIVELSDDGHPFDPVRHRGNQGNDASVPVEQRRIGGLGIHLVRQMSEKITYRRENDRNILRIQIGESAGKA